MADQTLSIILPTKNEAKGLKSLLPVLQNKFPDDKIIVVNDGSTDATTSVCEKKMYESLRTSTPWEMARTSQLR